MFVAILITTNSHRLGLYITGATNTESLFAAPVMYGSIYSKDINTPPHGRNLFILIINILCDNRLIAIWGKPTTCLDIDMTWSKNQIPVCRIHLENTVHICKP